MISGEHYHASASTEMEAEQNAKHAAQFTESSLSSEAQTDEDTTKTDQNCSGGFSGTS